MASVFLTIVLSVASFNFLSLNFFSSRVIFKTEKAEASQAAVDGGHVLGVSESAGGEKVFDNLKPSGLVLNGPSQAKDLGAATLAVVQDLRSKIGQFSDEPNPVAVEEKIDILPLRKEGSRDFEFWSAAGAVMDEESGAVLYGKDVNKKRSLASITKLMTALVFLDSIKNGDWEKDYTLTREDRRDGGRIYLYLGDTVKVKDLFYSSLVGSDNTATVAMVHFLKLKEADFVGRMNQKAKDLGMSNTSFEDVAGLSNSNLSTASDVLKLVSEAMKREEIRKAVTKKDYVFSTKSGQKKSLDNTDQLLDILSKSDINIVGGKTGYTEMAGYCFAGKFVDKNGRSLVTVVLGSPSIDSRFDETKRLVEWAYESYNW